LDKEKLSPYKRIKLAEMELANSEIPEMPSGYDELRVLVRVHHEPIGYVNLSKSEGTVDLRGRALTELNKAIMQHLQADALPCSHPAKIEESLSKPCPNRLNLDQAEDKLGQPALAGLFITVAVCTRNRAEQLAKTLEALSNQTYQNFEVLVIDNAPSDETTQQKVAEFTQNLKFRYLVEERPGLDFARNRAIKEAQGHILAYTDDDAQPDPDWLTEMARAFADPQVDAMTGLVVPAELETPAQITFEDLYGGFGKGFERILYHRSRPTRRSFPYSAGKFGAGCNMAFRLQIFEQIGDFDEALDVGTPTGGGGDIDIFIRVLRGGFTLLYEPRAVVRHLHRREMAALERQMAGYGRSFFAYLFKWAIIDRHRMVDIFGYAAQGWLRWIFLKALSSLLGRNGVPKKIALAQFRNAPLGPFSYWQARRKAAQIRRLWLKQSS
jgi:glycosyltransferase involved in cell wall biosynthesis